MAIKWSIKSFNDHYSDLPDKERDYFVRMREQIDTKAVLMGLYLVYKAII